MEIQRSSDLFISRLIVYPIEIFSSMLSISFKTVILHYWVVMMNVLPCRTSLPTVQVSVSLLFLIVTEKDNRNGDENENVDEIQDDLYTRNGEIGENIFD